MSDQISFHQEAIAPWRQEPFELDWTNDDDHGPPRPGGELPRPRRHQRLRGRERPERDEPPALAFQVDVDVDMFGMPVRSDAPLDVESVPGDPNYEPATVTLEWYDTADDTARSCFDPTASLPASPLGNRFAKAPQRPAEAREDERSPSSRPSAAVPKATTAPPAARRSTRRAALNERRALAIVTGLALSACLLLSGAWVAANQAMSAAAVHNSRARREIDHLEDAVASSRQRSIKALDEATSATATAAALLSEQDTVIARLGAVEAVFNAAAQEANAGKRSEASARMGSDGSRALDDLLGALRAARLRADARPGAAPPAGGQP